MSESYSEHLRTGLATANVHSLDGNSADLAFPSRCAISDGRISTCRENVATVDAGKISEVRARMRHCIASFPQPARQVEPVELVFAADTIRIERAHSSPELAGRNARSLRVGLRRPNSLSVVVVPRLADGSLLLAVRYLEPAGVWSLELPQLDNEDEDEGWRAPMERSLGGCGIVAGPNASLLGMIRLDPHHSQSTVLAILAEGCQLVAALSQEAPLVAGLIPVMPAIVDVLVRDGEIQCSTTLAAIALLRAYW